MKESFSKSYKQAGVDVTAGYKAVELMKKNVQSTYTKEVVSDIRWIWRTICTPEPKIWKNQF